MKKGKKIASLLLAGALLGLSFTGCKANDGGGGDTTQSGDDTAPVKIRWFQDLRGVDADRDRVIQKIEEINNIEIEFVAAPGGTEEQDQKLNLMISTGEQLDLVTMTQGIGTLQLQWARDGAVLPFDDYVTAEKYPNLNSILNADLYKQYKIDGKSYFQPMPLEAGNRGYIIRKDWLDKLGLEIPTTLDEYYEVLKAFVTQDPDGNGKDDTYGFFVSEPYGSNSFGYIARSFVNCGCWGGDWVELPDGSITQFVASDYAKDTFKFIKKCYDEGLFNKSFVNEKDAEGKMEDLMVQGKLGISDVTNITSFTNRFADAGVDVELAYLPPLKTQDGEQGTLPHSGGSWAFHVLPKTCSNPEKVLEFLEWCHTEEGRELTMYGIEGTHFSNCEKTESGRVFDINQDEMSKDWNTADYGLSHPLSWGGFNYSGGYIPMKENNYDFDTAYPKQELWMTRHDSEQPFSNIKQLNAQYAKVFPLQGSIDETVIVDQTLIDIEIQGRTKAIVDPAENFDANWQAMLDNWMASGGKELIERGNAAWDKLKES